MRKTLIILFFSLFVNIFIVAQNPFLTKKNVMTQFDVSPQGRMICCSWWGADGISKIRIKDLTSQKIVDVDSINLRKGGRPFTGVCFLSDNQVLFVKAKELYSYNLQKRKCTKLFDIPEEITQLATTKNKKGIYLMSEDWVYYADIVKGISSKKPIHCYIVWGITVTPRNEAIYTLNIKEKENQIWNWNENGELTNLTDLFSKEIKAPYLVEATSETNLYIVAGKEGVFRFHKTGNITKWVDHQPKDPIVAVKVSDNHRILYYQTYYQKGEIKTIDINGKRGEPITF